jgi:hypothetical protein
MIHSRETELRRLGPDVRDADVVLKQVLLLARRAALGEELAPHFDADAACRAVAVRTPCTAVSGESSAALRAASGCIAHT